MKILMPIHNFLPVNQAGAELYTYHLARELKKRHEITLIYTVIDPAGKAYSVTKGDYDGIPFYRIVNNHVYTTFEETYNNPRMDALFCEILDETRPDVVHIQHLLYLSVNFIEIAKKKGIPVFFTLHEYWLMCPNGGQRMKKSINNSITKPTEICLDMDPYQCAHCSVRFSKSGLFAERCYKFLKKRIPGISSHNKKLSRDNGKINSDGCLYGVIQLCDSSIKTLMEKILWPVVKKGFITEVQTRLTYLKKICSQVDLFIAPSPFLRGEFIKFGIPENKIVYSDYGMNMSYYKNIARRESERLRFTFIGSPVVHKGVHVLVTAFNGIDSSGAELNLYGDLSMQPEYSSRLISMAKNPDIHFKGRFENSQIGEILSNTDVLVVPSIWFENSPLTIHEAFIAGIPVITSNLGGMADLVKDGVNGLLFNVGDAEDLRAKILSLIKDPALIERLRQGIHRVKTIEEDALFMEGLYAKIVSK